MKLEWGIIALAGILAAVLMGLIVTNPDETPKSASFEKYSEKIVQNNKLSKKHLTSKNLQQFDESKKQMQELLKEISFDFMRLKISNVELIDGHYPFRDSSLWAKQSGLEESSVCNFEENIPLHMKVLAETENYERFAKKYSHNDLTLSIFDERFPDSNVHYGLTATNGKSQTASTYFHLDTCTNEITDRETLFLNCFDKNNGYRYATFNYEDIVSSYLSIDFCNIELDPWRQSAYEYAQKLNEKRRTFEMGQMLDMEDYKDQQQVIKEMNRHGDLENIAWSIVHGKFDEQKTQHMIKTFEKHHGSLPRELLELLEKRK